MSTGSISVQDGRSSSAYFADLYHWTMAAYHALRMAFDSANTAHTYRYCRHLDRTRFFRGKFERYLQQPGRVEAWKRRRLFVDDIPDPEAFKDYPQASVGRAYYEMVKRNAAEGLRELRAYRLQTLPEERKGLDLDGLQSATDPEDLYQRLVARRNIFMTSSHDYCHLLTGSSMELPGEALCAQYQYQHLLTPQNWLNRRRCMLAQLVSFRFGLFRRLRACFPVIAKTTNYAEVDLEALWDRPLREVRRKLGLPPDGFMPDGELAEAPLEERAA